MKVSTAINLLKASSLQNISQDFATDDIWLEYLNGALAYIYAYLIAKGSWYWANNDETITVTNGIATAKYGIYKVWELKDSLNSIIYQAPVSFNMTGTRAGDDEVTKGFKRSNTDSASLMIKDTNISKISLIYARAPKLHTITNLGTDDLDLPSELGLCIMLSANWLILPTHLEQGATLANNYYSQMNTYLDTYAYANVTPMTGFTV